MEHQETDVSERDEAGNDGEDLIARPGNAKHKEQADNYVESANEDL